MACWKIPRVHVMILFPTSILRSKIGLLSPLYPFKFCWANFNLSLTNLVGGLEHFLFFHMLGIIIPTDFHIFQRGRSTTNQCICLLVRFLWCDLFDHQTSRPRKAFDCDSDFPHRATSVVRQLINVSRKG
jgi:hypothetical protein